MYTDLDSWGYFGVYRRSCFTLSGWLICVIIKQKQSNPIHILSFKNMFLKMLPAKFQPFCPSLNVIRNNNIFYTNHLKWNLLPAGHVGLCIIFNTMVLRFTLESHFYWLVSVIIKTCGFISITANENTILLKSLLILNQLKCFVPWCSLLTRGQYCIWTLRVC